MTHQSKALPSHTRTPSVEFRPLRTDEALQVMAEVARSRTITGYGLKEWSGKRMTAVAIDPTTGDLLGSCLVHHLWGGWSEIAVVYVLEGHRDAGVGRWLLDATVRELGSRRRRALMFFCEPPMAHLARSMGFRIFDTNEEFAGRSWFRRFFINHLYQWQWLSSSFRRGEKNRKSRELDCSFDFTIGELAAPQEVR